MSILQAAADTSEEVLLEGVNPWVVGIVILAIFVALLLGLLAFGKGREHT